MSRPFFSVIMPVYNGLPYLRDSIASVLDQSFTDWELIVADDQSTDDSPKAVKEIQAAHPGAPIHYHRKPEKIGFSPARTRNFGLSKATGKWLAFLDQDDTWDRDKLRLHHDAALAHPEVGIIHNDQHFIDSQGQRLTQRGFIASNPRLTPDKVSGWCFETQFQGNFFGLSCVSLPRAVLDIVGIFNEDVIGTEDYDLFMRVTAKYPVHFIDRPLTAWRHHDTNTSKDGILMTENLIKAIRNVSANFPDKVAKLGPGVMENRLYFLYEELAGFFLKKGLMGEARASHLQALRLKPRSLGTWMRFIAPGLGKAKTNTALPKAD